MNNVTVLIIIIPRDIPQIIRRVYQPADFVIGKIRGMQVGIRNRVNVQIRIISKQGLGVNPAGILHNPADQPGRGIILILCDVPVRVFHAGYLPVLVICVIDFRGLGAGGRISDRYQVPGCPIARIRRVNLIIIGVGRYVAFGIGHGLYLVKVGFIRHNRNQVCGIIRGKCHVRFTADLQHITPGPGMIIR